MHQRTRVLLVEDNADNQEIYRTFLEYSGYEVLQAWDGEEGVAMARAQSPRVILMDLGLPRMDGLAATRLLKADPATSGIPIIALTAHALKEDRERVFEAGCDAFLAKPIEPRKVAAEIARWTGGGED